MNTTVIINQTKVEELAAQKVVELRSALADAKEAVEEAEAQFKALGIESVTLADGTKVASQSLAR